MDSAGGRSFDDGRGEGPRTFPCGMAAVGAGVCGVLLAYAVGVLAALVCQLFLRPVARS